MAHVYICDFCNRSSVIIMESIYELSNGSHICASCLVEQRLMSTSLVDRIIDSVSEVSGSFPSGNRTSLSLRYDNVTSGVIPFFGGAVLDSSEFNRLVDLAAQFYDNSNEWRRFELSLLSRSAAHDEDGYVYIAYGLEGKYEGRYKIGFSVSPTTRISGLGKTQETRAKMLFAIKTKLYRELERRLHDLFVDKRIGGEWFSLTDTDIKWLRTLAEQSNAA